MMMDQCRSSLAITIFLVCAFAIATPINNNGYFLSDGATFASAFIPNSCIERRRFYPHNKHQIPTTTGSITISHRLMHHLSMSSDESSSNDDENNNLEDDDGDTTNKNNDIPDSKSNSIASNEDEQLSWRLAKVRLEEANTRSFLKRKPLKLSYATSQKWIQNNWAPTTKAEFEDLVENGNLRTPYISKRPEEYYGRRGEWISWDHYLLGECGGGDSSVSDDGKNGTEDGGRQEVLKWQ